MDKEEILAKSRQENKDRDIIELEVSKVAGNWGAIAAVILSTLFFAIQIFVGGGANHGFWAVAFSVQAAGYTVKALKLKRKRDTVTAVIYVIVTLVAAVSFIAQLIASSTIL